MPSDKIPIRHVSDTALWVAYYRAVESDGPNPLFHDSLARVLVGHRGQEIARSMKSTSLYTRWTVILRTVVIDRFIQRLADEGVDTVINLGAGMDTRPYRLKLPPTLRWVEVDYPHVIGHKETLLEKETPQVRLERIPLDLADRTQRQKVFNELGAQSRQALVLTEGVLPYLSEAQVATLAEDLRAEKTFHYWIAEYFGVRTYRYFQTRARKRKMKHAPFLFFPPDWFGFFKRHGWSPEEVRYLGEEGQKVNRPMPFPWWVKLFMPLIGPARTQDILRQTGYVLFTRHRE